MNFFKKALQTFTGKPTQTGLKIIQLNIPSQYLGRGVQVDVFLPPNYENNHKETFPTLFFNDGQDMRAVGMAQTLTQLFELRAIPRALVVAIHCSDDRINEYGIADRPDYKNRGNKARAYNQFVMLELLPQIRKTFRSASDPQKNTFAGFSLGALSAFDIAWNNAAVFGKVGVFSGALWWRERAWTAEDPDGGRIAHDVVEKATSKPPLKFWFEVGTNDEQSDRNNNGVIDAIDDTLDLINCLVARGYNPHEDIKYLEIIDGEHSPATWFEAMPEFLTWALKN
jgi:enterochelin esterase-like enzyme